MKLKSISSKMLLAFSVIILIVLVVLTTITFINASELKVNAHKELLNATNLLTELINKKAEDAQGLASTYASDERLINAMKASNRAEMALLVTPIFKELQKGAWFVCF